MKCTKIEPSRISIIPQYRRKLVVWLLTAKTAVLARSFWYVCNNVSKVSFLSELSSPLVWNKQNVSCHIQYTASLKRNQSVTVMTVLNLTSDPDFQVNKNDVYFWKFLAKEFWKLLPSFIYLNDFLWNFSINPILFNI